MAILYKMSDKNQLSKNKYKKQTLRRDEFNLRDTQSSNFQYNTI